MPVGQSRAQPLQDRQRSSASPTAGSSKPERPVGDVLEHVRAAAGGVLLLAGGEVRRAHHAARGGVVGDALADAGAAVHGVLEGAGVVGEPQRRTHRAHGGGEPQVGVERRGVDEDTGVEQVVGVEDPLGLLHQGDRLRGVHPRQQLRAGAPVAVLARHRAAVRRHQVGRVLDEVPEPAAPAGVLELEVDAHVHAAVAEVAVGHAVQRRLCGAARRSRAGSRRASPAAPPRPPSPAWAGRVSERAASPAPSSRIRQSASCSATSVTIRCGTPAVAATACAFDSASAASAPVTSANSQPPPAGQLRVAGDHPGDALVEPLAGHQPVLQQVRVRRRPHRPSSGSRAPPAPGPGRPRPGGPWRRAPARACPRCRPGTGRTGGPFSGSRCSKE